MTTFLSMPFHKNKGLEPGLVTPIVSLRSTLSALRAVEMAVARLPSRDFRRATSVARLPSRPTTSWNPFIPRPH